MCYVRSGAGGASERRALCAAFRGDSKTQRSGSTCIMYDLRRQGGSGIVRTRVISMARTIALFKVGVYIPRHVLSITDCKHAERNFETKCAITISCPRAIRRRVGTVTDNQMVHTWDVTTADTINRDWAYTCNLQAIVIKSQRVRTCVCVCVSFSFQYHQEQF